MVAQEYQLSLVVPLWVMLHLWRRLTLATRGILATEGIASSCMCRQLCSYRSFRDRLVIYMAYENMYVLSVAVQCVDVHVWSLIISGTMFWDDRINQC